MIQWVKAVLYWIVEPRLFWLCTFVVVASVALVLFGGVSEPKIRIIGLLLQLCGIGTVVWGLRQTRKLFGRPGFFENLVEWLKRFPKYKPRAVSIEGNITLPRIQLAGSAHGWQSAGPEASIEKRLAVVERNLLDLNQRLVQVQQRIDDETRKITSELHEERVLREKEDGETKRKIELSQTGGLSISIMGLVWLLLGVILSTASAEIVKLFS